MDKTVHFVFGIFGNAFALFLYLSPLVTFKRIAQKKSTEQFSGLPYALTLLNNLIAVWEKVKIMLLLMIELVFFAAVVCVSLFALHGGRRRLVCGVLTDVLAIIMYAAPMSIIRLVIKTKSVEFMPFLLSLFVFLCGTSWMIFGLLGKDTFITIPSAFGCGLGAVQLILYAVYRKSKGEIKNPTTVEKPANDVQSHDEQV